MDVNTIDQMMKRGALHQFVDSGGEEDMAILSDPPCVVEIAGRKISVRALTLDNHKRWLFIFGMILQQFELILRSVEWPDGRSEFEAQREKWQTFFSADRIQRQAITMIEQSLFCEPGNRWWRWHKRWFRKHVTVIELTDLFFYLYLWNCEAVKKNVTFLLRRMGFATQKATLFGGWSANLAGHSGAQVQPRFPNAPPIVEEPSGSGPLGTRPSASSSSLAGGRPRPNTRNQQPPPLPRSVGR